MTTFADRLHEPIHDEVLRLWHQDPARTATAITDLIAMTPIEITDEMAVAFEIDYDLPGIIGCDTRAGLRAALKAAGVSVKEDR